MQSRGGSGRGAWLAATTLVATTLAAMAWSGAVSAHHSFAMFDSDHQIKVTGTVSRFDWTNPHIYLFVTGGEAGKDAKPMTIEGASPGILNRIGWKFNMVKAGDTVTMVIAPLRSGEPGGLLKEIKLSDGRVFNNGGFAGPSQISLKDEK